MKLIRAIRRRRLQVRAFMLACVGVSVAFTNGWAIAQELEHQPTIGKMVVQTIPAKYYMQGGFETDFKTMGDPVSKTLTALMTSAREDKVGLHGPVVHYYYGAPHRDPSRRFKMETGFFVTADVAAVTGFKVRKLSEFKCATIIYTGPAARIGDAWQELYRSVRRQGLTPADEERELNLYWEGVASKNNIVQVQVGVK